MRAPPRVTLIEGWSQPDGSRVAAIAIALDADSHTYWRVAGEAGIPPSFDWSQSTNLGSVRYEWPRPDVLDSYGIRSFGYVGSLVLPVLLTPKDPAAPMGVSLAVSFGVCNDICMQADARVDARLAPDGAPEGRDRIEAALAERARSAAEAGVARATCELVPGADGYELSAAVTFATAPATAPVAVFESGGPGLWVGEAESSVDGRTVVARAPAEGQGGAGPVLDRSGLRITLLDGSRAVDIRGCQAAE